ncbi:hypothetical protein MKX07_003026 [Trichoderma sp. CBMAI-0711]|nr:hypothetical protein MKX07_003026 [Trichoderma sp. CBMAI-0711]
MTFKVQLAAMSPPSGEKLANKKFSTLFAWNVNIFSLLSKSQIATALLSAIATSLESDAKVAIHGLRGKRSVNFIFLMPPVAPELRMIIPPEAKNLALFDHRNSPSPYLPRSVFFSTVLSTRSQI